MESQHINIHKSMFTLILLIFAIVLSSVSVGAYTPPIGIPDPGKDVYKWGNTHPIDTIAPNTATKCPSWPSEAATDCYYIDNTNPQATDIDNLHGYPDKPRSTYPAQTYPAGSYIEVHGGPYTNVTSMTLQGSAEKPIWFRGHSQNSMPDIRAKISIPDSTYAIIENLDFNNFPGGALSLTSSSAANNVCIRNCKFHNLSYPNKSSAVIGATPVQGGFIHDVIIYNNLFQDIGNYLATDDEDFHAINPSLWGRKPPTTVYNIWSLSNTAIRISGSLNQFQGDQRDANIAANEDPPRPITNTNLQNFHHMYSGKNLMYNSRQAMGAPKFTTDAIYSQNEVHDCYSISSYSGTGQGYQEGSRYVWIIFNKYYNLDYGIRQSNTNFSGVESADLRSYMVGNVIYNIYQTHDKPYVRNNRYKPAQGIGLEKGYYKRWIIDNTFYNVGGGINIGGNTEYGDTRLSGNVIAGVNGIDQNSAPDFHVSLLDANGVTNIDYMFFQPRSDNGTITFIWAGLSSSIQTSLSDFQTASGQCTNCWQGDPQFIDQANNNFHLKPTSPLKGKGVRNEVYDIFQNRYGLNIAYDFDGTPRPASGTDWNIGAFQGLFPPLKNISGTAK